MKLKFKKSDLVNGLKKVVSAAATGTNIVNPILNNVLMETFDDKVLLTCDNLNIKIESYVDCEVIENGAITLPATKLLQIAESLKSEITIEDNVIFENKTKIKIESIDADKYPKNLSKFKSDYDFIVDSKIFAKSLSKVIDMTCTDFRNIMSGIYTGIEDNTINFCASDSNILGYQIAHIDNKENFEFVMNTTIAKEIIKLSDSGDIKVLINHASIRIESNNTKIESRLLEGSFPPFKKLIPVNENILTIDKNYFAEILKRINIVYNQKEKLSISLNITGNKLDISYKDSVSEINEVMLISYGGDPINLKFGYEQLCQAIKNIDGDLLVLKIKDNKSGITINENDYLILVMPRIK